MNNLRTNLHTLTHTITNLRNEVRNMSASNRRTEENLTCINKSNMDIQAALLANTEALRSFIREDIQHIMASHFETTLLDRNIISKKAMYSNRGDNSSNNDSSNDHSLIFVPLTVPPPPPVAKKQRRDPAQATAATTKQAPQVPAAAQA